MPLTRPWYDEAPSYGDNVVIPRVWLTVAISVLLHVAALFLLVPILKNALMPGPDDGKQAPPLNVQLARAPAVRPPPSQPTPPQPAASPPPPPVAAPRRPLPPREAPRRPPVVAVRPQQPNPDAFRVPTPTPPTPAPRAPTPQPAPAPTESDMSAYIAARRAARGETAAPTAAPESDAARRDRIVAQNMAAVNRPQAYAGEPKNGGGLFEVTQVGYDSAEFKFFGWNRDIARRAAQVIEVRKGTAPDINTAIVRKMIAIIRETVTGDFTWRSDKVGHEVTLSARPEDQAALEEFLLKDMFSVGGSVAAGAPRR